MATTKTAAKKAPAKAKASTKAAADETKEEAGKTGPSEATDAKANPMSDPESHAVSAAELREMHGGGEKGAALAASADSAADRDAEREAGLREEQDNSTFGRLTRSGLVLNEVEGFGERYVGKSIQFDPDVPQHIKNRTRITPLSEVRPFRGLTVKPEGGEPFVLGDEFDKDATPAMWLGVVDPNTNKPLISAE